MCMRLKLLKVTVILLVCLDIITTLTNPDEYTKHDIAERYGFRWNSESYIRNIKLNLNLRHVRCQSPEIVRREL